MDACGNEDTLRRALIVITTFILLYIYMESDLLINKKVPPGCSSSSTVELFAKRYCSQSLVLCDSDSQCADTCLPNPPSGISWLCLDNICGAKRTVQDESERCNATNGGVWVTTTDPETLRPNVVCYCSYPEFFLGEACEEQNPTVCHNGGLLVDFDATKSAPHPDFCQCPDGHERVVLSGGGPALRPLPYCVPSLGAKLRSSIEQHSK